MTAAAYQNELETQFARLPGFLQDVLRDPFNWVDGVIKDIAGQPEQLTSAGAEYTALGQQITRLGQEQAHDRQSILNGAWEGQARDSFSAQMAQVEQQMASLGQATAQTRELLDSAAQACTESASMIVEIVEGVISFVLQDAVISGLASLVTFGGAAAAGAAAAVAKFASACEKIGGIAERLGTVLEKVASMLEKLAEICRTVVTKMRELQNAVKAAKKEHGMLATFTKDGVRPMMTRSAINTAVRGAAGEGLVGSPIPGLGGGIEHAGKDGYQAVKDVQQADEGQ